MRCRFERSAFQAGTAFLHHPTPGANVAVSELDTPAAIEVISRIYAAGLDASQWPATVAALTAWIGGEIGCLQLRRFAPEPSVTIVASGVDPAFERSYLEHYHRLDPHLSRVKALPQGRTVFSREVLSDDELFASEFYNEFFRPQGVCDLQGAMLVRSPTRVVTFVTESSLRERYDEHTRARLDMMVPHLTRSVEFTLRSEDQAAAQQALIAASLAQHSGLLRVSPELSLLEASEPTLAWLSQHRGALAVRDGRLSVSDSSDAERLRDCVRGALAQTTVRCELNGDAHETITLVVSPAARSLLYPEPSVFIVFAIQPRAARAVGCPLFEALPPALRPVAEALERGASDKEIAESLQLPLATARTYVSRTLRRLGLKNRRELLLRR